MLHTKRTQEEHQTVNIGRKDKSSVPNDKVRYRFSILSHFQTFPSSACNILMAVVVSGTIVTCLHLVSPKSLYTQCDVWIATVQKALHERLPMFQNFVSMRVLCYVYVIIFAAKKLPMTRFARDGRFDDLEYFKATEQTAAIFIRSHRTICLLRRDEDHDVRSRDLHHSYFARQLFQEGRVTNESCFCRLD